MKAMYLIMITLAGALLFGATILATSLVFAVSPHTQTLNIYDSTQDGLNVETDPVIGTAEVSSSVVGKPKLIITTRLENAVPNCQLSVELLRDNKELNGGLTETEHTGIIQTIGTLTTDDTGSAYAQFFVSLGEFGNGDTTVYGHIDFEDESPDKACGLVDQQYAAAPDPAANTPLSWKE